MVWNNERSVLHCTVTWKSSDVMTMGTRQQWKDPHQRRLWGRSSETRALGETEGRVLQSRFIDGIRTNSPTKSHM